LTIHKEGETMTVKTKAKPQGQTLEEIRSEIACTEQKLQSLQSCGHTEAEAQAAVRGWIARTREAYVQRLHIAPFLRAGENLSRFQLPALEYEGGLEGLLATFLPEQLEAVLLQHAREQLHTLDQVMTAAERTTKEQDARANLDQLERSEEAAVRMLEEAGHPVRRRREAKIRIVLDVDGELPVSYNKSVYESLVRARNEEETRLRAFNDRRAEKLEAKRQLRAEREQLTVPAVRRRFTEEQWTASMEDLTGQIQELDADVARLDAAIDAHAPDRAAAVALAAAAEQLVGEIEERVRLQRHNERFGRFGDETPTSHRHAVPATIGNEVIGESGALSQQWR
jgi:outer membrane murein-binding lipoprotein Lpp